LIANLIDNFIEIFNRHPDEERVIVPLFKTLERTFEKDEVLNKKDILVEKLIKIYELIIKEIAKTKSIGKLVAGVCTLVGLLRFGSKEVSKRVLNHCANIMLHKYISGIISLTILGSQWSESSSLINYISI